MRRTGWRPGASVGLLALLAGAALVVGHAGAAVTVKDDPSCWAALNELAAAAVFADLADDKLEQVYALLDQLQDQCEGRDYPTAAKTTASIEALVGK